MTIFCLKSKFLKVFDWWLQFLSLVLAENFLKSSPKCLLACVSSGTVGKFKIGDFLAKKCQKMGIF